MAQTLRAATYLDKGGVGKTTCAQHLGVAAAEQGERPLLIDLAGKQGDLAKAFGLHEHVQAQIRNDEDWPNVATVFDARWPDIADAYGHAEAIDQLVMQTGEGVDLIPAHPGLDGLDADLGNIDDVQARYSRLRTFLDEYIDPLDRYSLVLLDLPGKSDNIAYNGLWAAPNIIAPVAMGEFEIAQARGLERDLQKIRNEYQVNVELVMLVPNLFDRRTTLDAEILDEYAAEFGDALAPATVVTSQDIRRGGREGQSLFAFPEDHLLKTGREARDAFLTNANELLTRLTTRQ